MNAADLQALDSLLASDLSDATPRLVLADALLDAGREEESARCRNLAEDVAVLNGRLVHRYTFRHADDPESWWCRMWHYVYLQGGAESIAAQAAEKGGWGDSAPDYAVCDERMPQEEGDYAATLYGMPLVVCIRYRAGRGWLSGRAALADDPAGLAYASNPEDWR